VLNLDRRQERRRQLVHRHPVAVSDHPSTTETIKYGNKQKCAENANGDPKSEPIDNKELRMQTAKTKTAKNAHKAVCQGVTIQFWSIFYRKREAPVTVWAA